MNIGDEVGRRREMFGSFDDVVLCLLDWLEAAVADSKWVEVSRRNDKWVRKTAERRVRPCLGI